MVHEDSTLPSLGLQREEKEPPQMLMSPPPEETLRVTRNKTASGSRASSSGPPQYSEGESDTSAYAAKRKRNHAPASRGESQSAERVVASSSRVTLEATPNPKPRKQSKLHVSFAEEPTTPTKSSTRSPRSRTSMSPSKRLLSQSPHAHNPMADYVPPMPSFNKERASSRRRSATPVPLYVPPPDRFTPPREVVYTPAPSISKSSKRKSMPNTQPKSRRLTLQIKKELPEIDLNAPLPPPSPTDDPLLLHGPPPSTKRRPKAPRASIVSTHSRDTPPISSSSPIRPSQAEDSHLPDLNFANMDVDSDDDELPIPPLFDFDRPENVDEPWTDDEQDGQDGPSEFDHTGEYTGRFKIITVPTKADPPSSMTRHRQDRWGKPISPFPRSKLLPSTSALRYSPIPESPGQGEGELPVAEYDEEMPEATGLRSPSSAPFRSPPTNEADDDVPMDEAVEEPSPVASPQRPSPQLTDQHVEYAVDRSLDDDVPDHSTDEIGLESEAAAPMESIVEFTVRIPSEKDSSDPARLSSVEPMPSGEVAHVEEAPYDEQEEQDDTRSVVSYVDPEDVALDVPNGTSAVQHNYGVHSEEDSEDDLVSDIEETQVIQSPDQGPDGYVDQGPDGYVDHISVQDKSMDVPVLSESSVDSFTDVQPKPAITTMDDLAVEQSEWSFGVPQDGDDDDDDVAIIEEEDAFSVLRELSREPDGHKLGEGRWLAPPPLPTPRLPISPRNPFHLQTPGVVQTAANSRPVAAIDLRSARNASFTQFDLPEDDFDEPLLDTSIVKITSSDPMAAARAAAILRMHKYDCVENIQSPKQRGPYDLDSAMKSARRRSVIQSGIGKGPSSARRGTLGGVVGNTVIIDSTPRTTLAELLKEAEATIIMEEGSLHGLTPPKVPTSSTSFKTPARSASNSSRFEAIRSTYESPPAYSAGPREWSKADWKRLDSCYTDERLALSSGVLAPADTVDLEKVVDRFIARIGEAVVLTLGPTWSRDNLLKRARALQKKQMAGPHARSADSSVVDSQTPQQYSTLLSPNASILRDLELPLPAQTHHLASTSTSVSTSNATSVSTTASVSTLTTSTTPTLTNDSPPPDAEHSKLLKDAVAAEMGDACFLASSKVEVTPSQQEANRSFVSPLMPGRAAHSLASKVKGLLFSYLPRSPKAVSNKQKQKQKQKPAPAANGPVLPVPPPELFKKPRLPIMTPAPKRSAKPAAPKSLVQLNPVPPLKPSMIPRPTQAQRWVQLNPVPSRPSSSTSVNTNTIRERRDSGASVKDLVKTFEVMEKMQTAECESQKQLELKRNRSVRQWNEARTAKSSKPTWRP